MKYSVEQYAQALYEAFQDTKPSSYDTVINNLLQVLKKNGDLGAYEKIIDAFEAYEKLQKGIKTVEVTTASEEKLGKSVISSLNEIVGENLDIKHKVDSKIIGGVVVRVDDTLIDASVRKQLNDLEDKLSE